MDRAITTRVRGFAPWQPSSKSEELLAVVNGVLAEYRKHLPLTLRQIFYRLVGNHGYEKTELAYKSLCSLLNRARRAKLISFDAIRDDGVTMIQPHYFDDADDLVRNMIDEARTFRLHRQKGQKRRLFIAVEATGMVPLVRRASDPYGITVISCGGFDSTTAKYRLAGILARYPVSEILHIGDHDPSGVHVFSSMTEDIEAFVSGTKRAMGLGDVTFTRLAVTPEQVKYLNLPTAPPKATDHRAFEGETAQVEAIPPDVLSEIITKAILARVDPQVRALVLEEEERTRAHFRKTLIPALRDAKPEDDDE